MIVIFALLIVIVGGDSTTIQMQAAWATQQQSAASCVTPAGWDSCSSASWQNGACSYALTVGCATPDCDSMFAALFVPPLAPNDACVLASGYDNTTNTCRLQLDASCQAKTYHERFHDVGGTYFGYTVVDAAPMANGAKRAAGNTPLEEMAALMMLFVLATMVCLGCAPLIFRCD